MSSKKEVLLHFSPSKLVSGGSLDTNRIDDEHRLIARYAARLAADANNAVSSYQIKFEHFPQYNVIQYYCMYSD